MDIEERASNIARKHEHDTGTRYWTIRDACIEMANEQQNKDKEIIQMLIDILQTSKNYHLGITALDSEEEIIEKRRTRETALIRNIDDKIKRAKRAMEE